MNINNKEDVKQQAVREVIMKYLSPKVEYDGMTGWELAGIILREIENAGKRFDDEQKSPIRENFEADEYLAEVAADNDRETLAGV